MGRAYGTIGGGGLLSAAKAHPRRRRPRDLHHRREGPHRARDRPARRGQPRRGSPRPALGGRAGAKARDLVEPRRGARAGRQHGEVPDARDADVARPRRGGSIPAARRGCRARCTPTATRHARAGGATRRPRGRAGTRSRGASAGRSRRSPAPRARVPWWGLPSVTIAGDPVRAVSAKVGARDEPAHAVADEDRLRLPGRLGHLANDARRGARRTPRSGRRPPAGSARRRGRLPRRRAPRRGGRAFPGSRSSRARGSRAPSPAARTGDPGAGPSARREARRSCSRAWPATRRPP